MSFDALSTYVHSRDPEAFREIVESHHNMVYAVCRRKLMAVEDAEDAAQEVFYKLSRQAGTIRSDLAGWLHACAVKTSIDIIRRNGVREQRVREIAASSDNVSAGNAASPATSEHAELLSRVDQALLELSTEDRSLVVKYYFEGHAQSEIAQELGLTQPGARYRIERAIDRLRKKLAKHGVQTTAVAIGTVLASEAISETAPSGLKVSLIKIGAAGIGPEAATSFVGGAALGILSHKFFLLAVGLMAFGSICTIGVVSMMDSSAPPVSVAPPAVSGPVGTSLHIQTMPAVSYYQIPHRLTGNFEDFGNGVSAFYDAIDADGYLPVGPLVLVYPDGIDDPEHADVLLSSEVRDVGDSPSSDRIVHLPEYLCVALPPFLTDGEIPGHVDALSESLAEAGYRRTGVDRYGLDFGVSEPGGGPIGVVVGIESIPPP